MYGPTRFIAKIKAGNNNEIEKTIEVVVSHTGIGAPMRVDKLDQVAKVTNVQKARLDK